MVVVLHDTPVPPGGRFEVSLVKFVPLDLGCTWESGGADLFWELKVNDTTLAQRDEGAAILIVSTELDEVLALSDRILVIFAGKIAAELDPKTVTAAEIGLYMAGSKVS